MASIGGSSTQKSLSHTQMDRVIKVEVPSSHLIFFPYATLIQRGTSIPHFLSHISFIFICLQSIGISIWLLYVDTSSKMSQNDQDFNDKMQKYLSLILLFTPSKDDSTYIPVISTIGAVAIVINLLWLIPAIIFSKTQRVVNWLLPLQDFLSNVVSPVLVIPLFSHFSVGISQAFQKNHLTEGTSSLSTTNCVILLILSALACILNLVTAVCFIIFGSNTVYFPNSEYIVTNQATVLSMIIGQGVFSFFSYLSDVMGESISIAALVIHILFGVVLCILGFVKIPFMFKWVNYCFCGLSAASVISDICSRIVKLIYLRIVIIVCCWIVFWVIFKFVFDAVAKQKLKKFYENDNPDTNENANVKKTESQLLLLRNESKKSKVNVRVLIQLTLLYEDQNFTSGKLFERLLLFASTSEDRLQIAKYCCFFPDFQPLFTSQIALLRNITDFRFSQSFLFHQLCITETCRQPLSAVEELTTLRQEAPTVSTSMRASWSQLNSDISYSSFEKLSSNISLIKNHWEEAIDKYPKNALIAENYSRYLLEAEGDFEKSAEWHYRALQLQNGKVFEYDKATIHFLRVFPKFAKKLFAEISLASIDDLDLKQSEELLGSMISQPRLHMEYQKVVQNKTNGWLTSMLVLVVFRFLISISFWLALLIMFTGMFSSRVKHLQFIYDLSYISESIELSDIAINFQGAKEYYEMPSHDLIQSIINPNNNNKYADDHVLINSSLPYFSTSDFYSISGIERLNTFIQDLNQQSAGGSDLGLIVNSLTAQNLSAYFYVNKIPIPDNTQSFRSMLTFYFSLSLIVGSSPLPDPGMNAWVFQSPILELGEATTQILNNLRELLQSFIENDKKDVSDEKKVHLIIAIAFAAICFVLFIVLYIIFFVCMQRKFTTIINICRELKDETIKKASSQLADRSDNDAGLSNNGKKSTNVTLTTVNQKSYFSVVVFVFEIIVTILIIASALLFYYEVNKTHNKFSSMNELLLQSCIRSSHSILIFANFLKANLIQCSGHEDQMGEFMKPFEESIRLFTAAHEACLKGDYGNGKVGKLIEKIRTEPQCSSEVSQNITNHDSFACLPLDSSVSNFIELVKAMKANICTRKFVSSEDFIQQFHFLNGHLYYMLTEINNLVLELGKEQSDSFNNTIVNLAVIFFIVSILIFVIAFINITLINRTYKVLMMFLLRIPPIDAVNNTKLIDFLLGRKASQKNAKMSLPKKIVNNSSFPIIFLDNEQIIENVNQSFITDFGYDLSQIVGQNISMMTDEPEFIKTKLNKLSQKAKMKNEETVFEINFKKENKTVVKVEMTVVPIYSSSNNAMSLIYKAKNNGDNKDENSNENSQQNDNNNNDNDEDMKLRYFGLILNDLSNVILKENKCNELKSLNDDLLSKLSPSLFMGNSKIYLEQSVVMCVKLVYYGGSLTPAAFMKQRQQIFSKFNDLLEKRSLLTRVMINNGEYIVVGVTLQQSLEIINYINSKNKTAKALKSEAPKEEDKDKENNEKKDGEENNDQTISNPAMQCIEFSADVASLFDEQGLFGDYVIGIDSGDVSLFQSGVERKHIVISGKAMKNAQEMMRISNSGDIAVSETVYKSIATLNYDFTKMTNQAFGSYYLVRVVNDNYHEEPVQ